MLRSLGFSRQADVVYWRLVQAPDSSLVEIAEVERLPLEQVQRACTELVDARLVLRSDERDSSVVVLDPAVALNELLCARTAELARQQEDLATAKRMMTELAEAYSDPTDGEPTTEDGIQLAGTDEIRRVLTEFNSSARDEVLAMHPSANYSSEQLEAALDMDLRALHRGVTIRSVYTTASREHAGLLNYQRESARHGAQIRYADHVPMRMLVCDREVGLVPMHAADNGHSATLVRSEALTSVLVLTFEQLWSSAEPITLDDSATAPRDFVDVTDVDRTLLKLLSMGVKDEAAARHLGVSVRTVRRQIANLMERLEANSRFQAGMQAVQRGWIDAPVSNPRPHADLERALS